MSHPEISWIFFWISSNGRWVVPQHPISHSTHFSRHARESWQTVLHLAVSTTLYVFQGARSEVQFCWARVSRKLIPCVRNWWWRSNHGFRTSKHIVNHPQTTDTG